MKEYKRSLISTNNIAINTAKTSGGACLRKRRNDINGNYRFQIHYKNDHPRKDVEDLVIDFHEEIN